MRDTDDLQTTLTLSPVNRQGPTLSLELGLEMTLPIPPQDEHLPDQIETLVHHVGLDVMRRLFQALIEKADQELVLRRRYGRGGEGIQCRGTRPDTFKTLFGEVTVRRTRVRHNRDGRMEIPSALARGTPHQRAITRNLRDAVCDRMGEQSARPRCAEICHDAGDEELPGPSTILDIVHQEGERLIAAQRRRARSILDGGSEAREVWTYTAVVLVADCGYCFAEATAQGLWSPVGALLLELGVLSGKRRLLVPGDGASWLRSWFEGPGISPKAMIL